MLFNVSAIDWNQVWTDIKRVFLHMDKQEVERHTQWKEHKNDQE